VVQRDQPDAHLGLDYLAEAIRLEHRIQWRASDGVEFCAECNVEWPCAVERVIRIAQGYRAALCAIRDLPQGGVVETKAALLAAGALA